MIYTIAMRLSLLALTSVTLTNYIVTLSLFYIWDIAPSRDNLQTGLLFATTLISGFVINMGTIIQIVTQLRQKTTNVDFKYTECLLVGCFVLFVSQIHATTIELILLNDRSMDRISLFATPITTLFSLLCVLIFYLVTKRQITRERYALPATRFGKDIVFVEGTACIGKTTSCDVSFDFARYMDERKLYGQKHECAYVQSLYEANLYADILNEILMKDTTIYGPNKSSSKNYYFFDRWGVSQLVYAILFHLDGPFCHPDVFVARFDETILRNCELVDEIKRVFNKWALLFENMNPHGSVSYLWYGARKPVYTASLMTRRNGSECRMKDWNLVYYTQNQNYVFRKIQEITGLGKYHEMDVVTYDDLVSHVNESYTVDK